jgi:hypothetical protein
MAPEELDVLKAFASQKGIGPEQLEALMPVIDLARVMERLACERIVHDQAQGDPAVKLEMARLSKLISART